MKSMLLLVIIFVVLASFGTQNTFSKETEIGCCDCNPQYPSCCNCEQECCGDCFPDWGSGCHDIDQNMNKNDAGCSASCSGGQCSIQCPIGKAAYCNCDSIQKPHCQCQ